MDQDMVPGELSSSSNICHAGHESEELVSFSLLRGEIPFSVEECPEHIPATKTCLHRCQPRWQHSHSQPAAESLAVTDSMLSHDLSCYQS